MATSTSNPTTTTTTTTTNNNDPWSAFGDDDDDDDCVPTTKPPSSNGIVDNDDDDAVQEAATAVATTAVSFLAQRLLRHNPTVPLSLRSILVIAVGDDVGDAPDETVAVREQSSSNTNDNTRAATDMSTTIPTTAKTLEEQIWTETFRNRHMANVTFVSQLDSKRHHPTPNPIHNDDDDDDDHTHPLYDAVVVLWPPHPDSTLPTTHQQQQQQHQSLTRLEQQIDAALVPGGCLVWAEDDHGSTSADVAGKNNDGVASWFHIGLAQNNSRTWDLEFRTEISASSSLATTTAAAQPRKNWQCLRKWPCRIASQQHPPAAGGTAPRIQQRMPEGNEQRLLSLATVALTVHERHRLEEVDPGATGISSSRSAAAMTSRLSPHSVRAAVTAMEQYGYCVIPGLLSNGDSNLCVAFGQAVLKDLHQAAAILLERDAVDVFHPTQSVNEPESYRELSMREDYRMDVRYGPALNALRRRRQRGATGDDTSKSGNHPVTIRSSVTELPHDFLRGHADILTIVRRVMNPTLSAHVSAGNFGRYNFDGGGPDGSFQPLVAGIVGAIVSLPGSVDQAIHADAPHLFEHAVDPQLPPHYINVFTPGCSAVDGVGQTAFIHGSHRLDFVARHCQQNHDGNDNRSTDPFDPSIWDHLVRPRLDIGDVLLFDCRMLHFGLANQHATVQRPLLYTNMTMHWFHDPKNWDQQRRIFQNLDDDMASSTDKKVGDDDN